MLLGPAWPANPYGSRGARARTARIPSSACGLSHAGHARAAARVDGIRAVHAPRRRQREGPPRRAQTRSDSRRARRARLAPAGGRGGSAARAAPSQARAAAARGVTRGVLTGYSRGTHGVHTVQQVACYFNGLALANYLVSTANFHHPVSRRPLTRDECVRLDQHVREHRVGGGCVTRVYDTIKAFPRPTPSPPAPSAYACTRSPFHRVPADIPARTTPATHRPVHCARAASAAQRRAADLVTAPPVTSLARSAPRALGPAGAALASAPAHTRSGAHAITHACARTTRTRARAHAGALVRGRTQVHICVCMLAYVADASHSSTLRAES